MTKRIVWFCVLGDKTRVDQLLFSNGKVFIGLGPYQDVWWEPSYVGDLDGLAQEQGVELTAAELGLFDNAVVEFYTNQDDDGEGISFVVSDV